MTLRSFFPMALLCAINTHGNAEIPPPSIDVVAYAVVYVVPDKVDISLSVEVFHAELAQARQDHDERVRRVLSALRELKVADKDVQTESTYLRPEYEQDQHRRDQYDKRKGFRATKEIGVTLHDAKQIETVVNAVLENGATGIGYVRFSSTELRKHRDEARRMAARLVREKAELIAGELQQKVGRALRISERIPDDYSGGQLFQGGSFDDDSDEPDTHTTFALGQIEIGSRVAATFELIQ